MEKLAFTSENIINCVYNEPSLWNTDLNASVDDKNISWKKNDYFVFVFHFAKNRSDL